VHLENLEFVIQSATAAVMKIDADDTANDLLRLDEEGKGRAHNCIVDQEVRLRYRTIDFIFGCCCLLIHDGVHYLSVDIGGCKVAQFNKGIAFPTGNEGFNVK
jgi:hypothetical protein